MAHHRGCPTRWDRWFPGVLGFSGDFGGIENARSIRNVGCIRELQKRVLHDGTYRMFGTFGVARVAKWGFGSKQRFYVLSLQRTKRTKRTKPKYTTPKPNFATLGWQNVQNLRNVGANVFSRVLPKIVAPKTKECGWNPDFHMLHGCTMMQQCAFHVSFARYCPFCTFCDLVFLCSN